MSALQDGGGGVERGRAEGKGKEKEGGRRGEKGGGEGRGGSLLLIHRKPPGAPQAQRLCMDGAQLKEAAAQAQHTSRGFFSPQRPEQTNSCGGTDSGAQ